MSVQRAARLAAYGWALDVAHDVADHVIQTDDQARGKAHNLPIDWVGPMAGHVAGQAAAQGAAVALCATLAGSPGWRRVSAALGLSLASHALLDRRWPVVELLERTGSARFARPLVRTTWSADGYGRATRGHGVPNEIETTGALPLHGPYLADQALHRLALLVVAWLLSGGRR